MEKPRRLNIDNLEQVAQCANDKDTYLKAIPFKICIIGNSSVGKTCLVQRYINNTFSVQSNTLAAALMQKVVFAEPLGTQRTKIKLQIWDTAGAEEYRSINSLYYKKAAVVFLVYSVTDYESFDSLKYWVNEIETNGEPNCIKFVVGTKIDDNEVGEGEAVTKHIGQEYASQIQAKFFLTSAKENIGINKMFQTAADMCAQQTYLRNDLDRMDQNLAGGPKDRTKSVKLDASQHQSIRIDNSAYQPFDPNAPELKQKKGGCC